MRYLNPLRALFLVAVVLMSGYRPRFGATTVGAVNTRTHRTVWYDLVTGGVVYTNRYQTGSIQRGHTYGMQAFNEILNKLDK